jgi:hypothetical protein
VLVLDKKWGGVDMKAVVYGLCVVGVLFTLGSCLSTGTAAQEVLEVEEYIEPVNISIPEVIENKTRMVNVVVYLYDGTLKESRKKYTGFRDNFKGRYIIVGIDCPADTGEVDAYVPDEDSLRAANIDMVAVIGEMEERLTAQDLMVNKILLYSYGGLDDFWQYYGELF